MRRRELIGTGLAAATLLPFAAFAQKSGPVRRIAVLMGFPENDVRARSYVAAMRQKLQGLGWTENRNLQITYRWAGGDPQRTRAFAKELIALSPSVIVTSTNQVTEIVRQETKTIPIVFASLGDPIGSGLVESMNRPGGNVTGFPAFVDTMAGKWLELVKEIAPRVTRVGFIHHPSVAPHRGLVSAAQTAAPALSLNLIPLAVLNPDDIMRAVERFAPGEPGALVTASHALTYSSRDLIISLAAKYRLPTLFGEPIFTESGALVSYGSDQLEMFTGAATYVDQILKGSRVAEMPVQLPTKFVMTFNLKTAQAIGVTIPPTLLARADMVVE